MPRQKPAPVKKRPTLQQRRQIGFDWYICLGLLLMVLAVYAQTARFGFVNFDDPDYVAGNPHVRAGWTAEGVRWAFTSHDAANWFPLTRLSHMADVEFFGMRAGPEHLENALLHALAAALLFAFLKTASGARWPSAFTAALFAIHPLHVESVAWIAERKDVLSAVFWFLTLWSWACWTRRGGRQWYGLALAAFCCGWMAKPMIVTLPVVLLLLDLWPLARPLPLAARLKEKIPFFAISAAGAVVTYAAQQGSGAVQSLAAFPLPLRLENALLSYAIYIGKTVWPARLAVFYPYPHSIPIWQAAAAGLLLAAISFVAARRFREQPYLAVGWCWFVVTLLPVIGLVQAGAQARADRYMYVPMAGLGILLSWAIRDWLSARTAWRLPVGVAAGAGLVALAVAASAQTACWQNSGTLFQHALDVTRDNALAEHNLGIYLLEQPGRLADALAHLQRAVQLNPASARAHSDLGNALARIGREQEAIAEYRDAIRIDPGAPIPHNNLANTLARVGRQQDALAEYQEALRLDPDYAEARANLAAIGHSADSAERHYNQGVALAGQGRPAEAVAEFETALRMNPNYADAENNLGVALTRIPGRGAEAIVHFRAAIRLQPDYADAHYNLGVALSNRPGEMPDALREFEIALRLRPDPELQTLVDRLRRGQ